MRELLSSYRLTPAGKGLLSVDVPALRLQLCCSLAAEKTLQSASPIFFKGTFLKTRLFCPWNRAGIGTHYHSSHALLSASHTAINAYDPSVPAAKTSEDDKLDDDKQNANEESITLKLRRYGVAGMLSYGLFNTIYYLGMFLFAWLYISPAPRGLGYRAAAERFIKLLALVWAGSQVTKLLRAGCALALAPLIDKVLTWLTENSRFRSRAEVFGIFSASCFGLILVVFLVITYLWA